MDASNGHPRSKPRNIGLSLKLGSVDEDMKCSVTTNFLSPLPFYVGAHVDTHYL